MNLDFSVALLPPGRRLGVFKPKKEATPRRRPPHPLALATALHVHSLVDEAYDALTESFEQFCPMAGIESLTRLVNEDVTRLAGWAL